MVTRMEEEAAASATKFQWCQDELAQNEETRGEKGDEVEKLEALRGDAKAAQAAVAQALTVLNEFYAKAAAFVQTGAPYEAPPGARHALVVEVWPGMTAQSGGVIGMIEVIQSDFARLEAETSSAEKQSVKDWHTRHMRRGRR
eukprot:Skav220733  [mRNA]  locus=scaffold2753:253497:258894:- [translate_table: standard]